MVTFILLCYSQYCRSGRIYVRAYHFLISPCIQELMFIGFEYLKVFLACQGPTVVANHHCYHLQGQPGTAAGTVSMTLSTAIFILLQVYQVYAVYEVYQIYMKYIKYVQCIKYEVYIKHIKYIKYSKYSKYIKYRKLIKYIKYIKYIKQIKLVDIKIVIYEVFQHYKEHQ